MIYIIFPIIMIALLIWAFVKNLIIKKKGIFVEAEVIEIKEKSFKTKNGETYPLAYVYTVQFRHNNEVVNACVTTKEMYDIGTVLQGWYTSKKEKKVVYLKDEVESVTFSKISIIILALVYFIVLIIMAKLEIVDEHLDFLVGGVAVIVLYGFLISHIGKK